MSGVKSMDFVKRRVLAGGIVAGFVLAVAPLASPAAAHQHLFNPSGTCPSENANVPQGIDNPGGQTPGDRNQANAKGAQGGQNCN